MIHFAEPYYLFGIFLLPIILFFYRWAWKRREKALSIFGNPKLIKKLTRSVDYGRRKRKIVLIFISFTFSILFGARSSASILLDVSNAIIMSSPCLTTSLSTTPHWGLAKARIKKVKLIKISLETDGKFYQASAGELELEKIYDEINQMEQKELRSEMFTFYEDRYQWFLGIALLFLLIESFLTDRSRKEKEWMGRFE